MNIDTILKIINTVFQLILVIFAGLALLSWKKEVRGKDKYNMAKDLLNYIERIRFLVYEKNGSFHQIYIQDIFIDRKRFYEKQLSMIKTEEVMFDQSVFSLFKHIAMRSNLFLPKSLRLILENLYPLMGKDVGTKDQFTYIKMDGIEVVDIGNLDNDKEKNYQNIVYEIHNTKNWTIEEYFKCWEKLVIELQKLA